MENIVKYNIIEYHNKEIDGQINRYTIGIDPFTDVAAVSFFTFDETLILQENN